MADRSPTRRIEKNEHDLLLMQLRDEIAKLASELKKLSEQPADQARRVAIEARLKVLRQDLMTAMAATDRLV